MGYRNAFDMAFNRDGDLFTYDSDMEWDQNTPWYRPTRVCMAADGADFGYRNGAGKWPAYYIDGTPPVVNIGPGSPTGVTFGYGAKFPDQVPGRLLHLRLVVRQALRRPPQARRRGLRRGRRGVPHRRPAPPDRRRHQPDRRGDVLRHRRQADDLGPVPGDLLGRGIHRALDHRPRRRRGPGQATPARSLPRPGPTPGPSPPPGRSWATPTARSATPPAWRSSSRIPPPGPTRPWPRRIPSPPSKPSSPSPRSPPPTRRTGPRGPRRPTPAPRPRSSPRWPGSTTKPCLTPASSTSSASPRSS